MQVAAFAVLALLIYIAVLVSHLSEITSFYELGHLDPWLRFEVILAAIVLFTLFMALVSSLRTLLRPLRLITKLKFALVIFSCVYLGCFIVFFHLVGSPTHF